MKKLRFLLLDANVIIHLFELGLWKRVVDKCDVVLARTVVEDEAQFFFDANDERHEIDLTADVTSGSVSVVDVSTSELKEFRDRFDPLYIERLDAGEAESLAYLVRSQEPFLICSSDAIVFRVLAQLQLVERGMSLEEILQQIGFGRSLRSQFTRQFRERWTKRGFEEGLGGTGLRPSQKP